MAQLNCRMQHSMYKHVLFKTRTTKTRTDTNTSEMLKKCVHTARIPLPIPETTTTIAGGGVNEACDSVVGCHRTPLFVPSRSAVLLVCSSVVCVAFANSALRCISATHAARINCFWKYSQTLCIFTQSNSVVSSAHCAETDVWTIRRYSSSVGGLWKTYTNNWKPNFIAGKRHEYKRSQTSEITTFEFTRTSMIFMCLSLNTLYLGEFESTFMYNTQRHGARN